MMTICRVSYKTSVSIDKTKISGTEVVNEK